MLVSYACGSTRDQQLELQHDALEKVGCKKRFTDVARSATSQRDGLEATFGSSVLGTHSFGSWINSSDLSKT